MERLTKISEIGNAYYPKCFEEPCCGMGECLDDKCSLILDVCKKLAEYEQLEEQGLLVRLPDDLKKKVYRITYEYTECSNFGETKNNCENYNCNRDCDSQKRFYIVENRLEFMLFCNYYHELGKTVFLTREEAEKKLKELKNEI